MKAALIILLALVTCFAYAGKVYKWTDANGKVHFSDKPPPSVKKTAEDLGIETSIPKPAKEDEEEVLEGAEEAQGPETEEEKKPTVYKEISIAGPKRGATIRTNSGQVTISVNLDPPLDSEFKHKVAVFVDGKRKGYGQRTSFTATKVWPGTHRVQAKVTDEKGKVLKSSAKVTFYVKRGG